MNNTPTESSSDKKKAGKFPTKILSLAKDEVKEDRYEKDSYFLVEGSDKLYYSDKKGQEYVFLNSKNDLITMEEVNLKNERKKCYLDYLVDSDIDYLSSNSNVCIKDLETINQSRNRLFALQNFGFFLLKEQDTVKLCIKTSNEGNFNIINSSFSLEWKDIKSEIIPLSENEAKDFINKNNVFSKKNKDQVIVMPTSKSKTEKKGDLKNLEEKVSSDKKETRDEDWGHDDSLEEKDIINNLLYWQDSKTVKFRYAENWCGINIWRETNDIWGIARRVRNFFAEKRENFFDNERYKLLWESDYSHFVNQYRKMAWIKNDLGKIISENCSFVFNNSRSWIDQLPSEIQKKIVVDYINKEINSETSCDCAIDFWAKKDNIDTLVKNINIKKSEDEPRINNIDQSFFQRAKNKIMGWFGKKK